MIYHLGEVSNLSEKQDLAIGAFDAMHLGHQALFAHLTPGRSVVTLFNPLPSQFFYKDFPGCVVTFRQRCKLVEVLGVSHVLQIDFSQEFSRMLGDQFLDAVQTCIPLRKIVVGENFCMGKGRSFTTDHLIEWGRAQHVEVVVVPPVGVTGRVFTASIVREAVQSGNFALVAEVLGRPYVLDLSDLPGEFSDQGFVVDLKGSPQVLPPDGVYEIESGQAQLIGKKLILPDVFVQCVFTKKLG